MLPVCVAESERIVSTPSLVPAGAWPYQMSAELAAGYVGEPSVEAFRKKCGTNRPYPQGRQVPGGGIRWRRTDLEAAIDRLHSAESAELDIF